MTAPKIVFVSAARSPIGAVFGGLADVLARPLAIHIAKTAIDQSKVDPKLIGHSAFGWALQDPRSPNIAKTVVEFAGGPITAGGTTLHENCSSGGAAIHDIARRLLLGEIDVGLAGGVESMSNAARYMYGGRNKGQPYGDMQLVDGLMAALTDTTVGKKGELMGLLTERLVEKYKVSRETQDEIAFRSHANAIAAWEGGKYDYVTPVTVPKGRGKEVTVSRDEGPKKLDEAFFTKAKPYFKPEGGTITSSNSSSLNDGAAVVVMSTEARAKELGLPILAELKSYGNIGVPKELMGEGAFKVVPKVVARTNGDVKISDIDRFEMNEAFAAVVGAAFVDIPEIKPEKVNQWGSGISLGHPVACTGVRQVVDMIHQLGKPGNGQIGLTSRCVGGGMGSGEIIRRL